MESFEIYLVLRALLGIASVSVTYSGLILAIEYVDGVWRTIAGMYNLFPLPLSYIMISGIAYLTQDYKYLQLCIGMPGVFLLLLWYVKTIAMYKSCLFHDFTTERCSLLQSTCTTEDLWCEKKIISYQNQREGICSSSRILHAHPLSKSFCFRCVASWHLILVLW